MSGLVSLLMPSAPSGAACAIPLQAAKKKHSAARWPQPKLAMIADCRLPIGD
jgi:hypothetical protein